MVDIQLYFSQRIQNIHAETRHRSLQQASEQCFRKTPDYLKKSQLQEGGMFGVLRKHRSEACGRRLCLVINKFLYIILLKYDSYLGKWYFQNQA